MYATIEDIKSSSRNLEAILCASNGEIREWMEEAFDVINTYCSQDFSFEQQKTKVFRADNFIINLDKILSGDISVVSQTCEDIIDPKFRIDRDGNECLEFGDYQLYPGKAYFIYHKANKYWPPKVWPGSFKPDMIEITGDWGYAPSHEFLLINLANDIRSSYLSHISNTDSHLSEDLVNVITEPECEDLAGALSLINEVKAALNSHAQDSTYHPEADDLLVSGGDASDLESAILLVSEIKKDFNDHLKKSLIHTSPDKENVVVLSVDTPVIPRVVRRVFIKLVKRLAIRSAIDDQLQYNSYYQSETTGDGYSYNLSNGTMRNLLRPEDKEALWPYVNHGAILR